MLIYLAFGEGGSGRSGPWFPVRRAPARAELDHRGRAVAVDETVHGNAGRQSCDGNIVHHTTTHDDLIEYLMLSSPAAVRPSLEVKSRT